MRRPNATKANTTRGQKTNIPTLTSPRPRLHVPQADGAAVAQERRGLPVFKRGSARRKRSHALRAVTNSRGSACGRARLRWRLLLLLVVDSRNTISVNTITHVVPDDSWHARGQVAACPFLDTGYRRRIRTVDGMSYKGRTGLYEHGVRVAWEQKSQGRYKGKREYVPRARRNKPNNQRWCFEP